MNENEVDYNDTTALIDAAETQIDNRQYERATALAAIAQANSMMTAANALVAISESLAKVAAYCDFRGNNEALHGSHVTDRDFYG